MERKNTDDVMNNEEADLPEPKSIYQRRMRVFMEMMEDIYGKDVRTRITPTDLIARHRDVAAKLLLINLNLPRKSDLFAKPKTNKAEVIN